MKAGPTERRMFGDLVGVMVAVPGLLEDHEKMIRARLKVNA